MPLPRSLSLAALAALVAVGVQFSAADFVSGSTDPANALSAHADWSAPAASASVIAKTAGGVSGYIKQGGTYYVYANVADTGNPATGTATVTTSLTSLSSGAGAVALTAGSYAIDGVAYNYRSASLTARGSLTATTYPYALALADAGGNSTSQSGFSVTVDNTAATATDVQTINVAGGTAGKPDLGDQIVLTYSEPVDPNTVLAGWSGATKNVVARVTEGGVGNDTLTVRNTTNSAQLPLGAVNLARTDVVTATRDFGASGTAATMVRSGNTITLTLGTPSGTTGTVTTAAAMIWTPSATATDRAGNATATTARTETGASDVDF